MSGNQPVEVRITQNATHYVMDHHKRGIDLIFNHELYNRYYADRRDDTNVDRNNLRNSLATLRFDPSYYQDLTVEEIKSQLEKVSEMDHSAHDCLVIVMLTDRELGQLYAFDKPYNMDIIFSFFTGDKCKSLAGKPKIFFIQACQGGKSNPPTDLVDRTVSDGLSSKIYRIPTYADFLVAHSMCVELNDNGTEVDLLTLLTNIARRVAIDYQSCVPNIRRKDKHYQFPCTTSMLMRVIKFTAPRKQGV